MEYLKLFMLRLIFSNEQCGVNLSTRMIASVGRSMSIQQEKLMDNELNLLADKSQAYNEEMERLEKSVEAIEKNLKMHAQNLRHRAALEIFTDKRKALEHYRRASQLDPNGPEIPEMLLHLDVPK